MFTVVVYRVPEAKPRRTFSCVKTNKQVHAIKKLYKPKHSLFVRVERGLDTPSKPVYELFNKAWDIYYPRMLKHMFPSFYNSVQKCEIYRPTCLQNCDVYDKLFYETVMSVSN